jgi:threonine synthase
MREVVATTSPSMDIQISSNFERLLFEAGNRDAAAVRRSMEGLKQARAFSIEEGTLKRIRKDFKAGRATRRQAADAIRDTLKTSGLLIDPHTATGVHVAAKHEKSRAPMVTLATAHPAKFPDAVKSASGLDPELPAWLSDLMLREERYETLASDLDAVEAFILRHARAAS